MCLYRFVSFLCPHAALAHLLTSEVAVGSLRSWLGKRAQSEARLQVRRSGV